MSRVKIFPNNPAEETHLWRNLGSLPGHVRPPDHEIGVGGDPQDGAQEGDDEELLSARRPRVGQRKPQGEEDGRDQQVGESLLSGAWPGHVQGFWFVFDIVVALEECHLLAGEIGMR